MSTELIINSTQKGERIALLQNKSLIEYHFESNENKFNVGDIFLGTVKRVMAGLNAVFVDVGYDKDAFLHYHDLGPNYKTLSKFQRIVKNDRKAPVTLSNVKFEQEIDKFGKISQHIKSGQQILVQVTKEPISSKGPRLSCEISIAGRFLVLVPFSNAVSVSRKIASREERKRLKDVILSIKPKNFGVIIRTVAQGKELSELDTDLRNLLQIWVDGMKRFRDAKPRDKVIGELNRTSMILRDMLNESFDSVQVDSQSLYNDLKTYLVTIAPEKEKILKLYNGKVKIFESFGVEKQIKSAFGKSVSVPGGGYLIIEQTEALFVIDVNSGNISEKGGQESTALEVNLKATAEIARQLRLRDIGGIIVIDFIDMKSADNKKAVFNAMKQELKSDRSKHTILPVTRFGLMQITRQRVRPVVAINTSELCPTCNGTGNISASILVSDQIYRVVDMLLEEQNERSITLFIHPFLHAHLTKGMFSKRFNWFLKYKKWVHLYQDSSLPITEFKVFNKAGEEIELV